MALSHNSPVGDGSSTGFFPEIFKGDRRSTGQAKQTGSVLQAASVDARDIYHRALSESRDHLTGVICDRFTDRNDPRTIDMRLERAHAQYLEALGATILGGARKAAINSHRIDMNQAVMQIGQQIIDLETFARLRSLDASFGRTVIEHSPSSRLSRILHRARLNITMKTPVDILLEGHGASDTEMAQMEYGAAEGREFTYAYVGITCTAQAEAVAISAEDITTRALAGTVGDAVAKEQSATQQALALAGISRS